MAGVTGGVDKSLLFRPVRIAVLTVSDTRTRETDASGDMLQNRIESDGHVLAGRALVKDEPETIRATVQSWIADPSIDVILTTGGTGLTGRDVTVEAVRPLFEKEIEGFAVLFHQVSFKTVGVSTLQSRACAGLAGGTFVFLLPGSTGAVRDAWDNIIRLEIDSRHRPCNLVDLMPRTLEK